MNRNQEKLQKLAYVAQRYYLDDWKQSDIAKELGVSRPLVSRMLQEARELGVVKIMVCPPVSQGEALVEQLRRSTSIRDGVLVEDGRDDDATNQLLSHVWGWDSEGDSSVVAEHIRRIRKKLAAAGAEPDPVETVWGMGYRWRA